MSEQSFEAVPDDTQGSEVTQDTGDAPVEQVSEQESRAPWSDFVEKFPTAYRGIAEEAAKEWDAGVTKRFQDLHSTYEPYKQFVDEWEPDAISQAIQLAQALERDPESFYRALANSYGFAESEQGAANQEQDPEVAPLYGQDDPYAPQLQQHEELLRTLAEHILGQEQAQREEQEMYESQQMLDQALSTLREQHGEYDETFVLNAIANGVDPEQAVMQFKQMVNQWASRQNAPASNAPRIMGGGNGSIPSNKVDPAQLSRNETKSLVEQYLRTGQGG